MGHEIKPIRYVVIEQYADEVHIGLFPRIENERVAAFFDGGAKV
jgi:hypothetical protein